MFYGQTSNWMKQVREVTRGGDHSVPHIASQYVDGVNAIRIHCGTEMHVQVRAEFYMTSDEDLRQLDAFLNYFGLPRNGYQIVDTRQTYQPPYPAYAASPAYENGSSSLPLPIAPPNQR